MSKVINPEHIYPRRLGMYRGDIVLEYYYLPQDKFKKHLIKIEAGTSTNNIVEQIFKNPKHGPFLRKVDIMHFKKALNGDSNIGNSLSQPYKESFSKPSYLPQNSINNSKENSFSVIKNRQPQVDQSYSQVFQQQSIAKQSFKQSIGKISNKQQKIQKKLTEQDIDKYYDEQFQQFDQLQFSQSQAKPTIVQETKAKQKQHGKKQKQIIEDEFQFLDEQENDKKKKKKKNKKETEEKQASKSKKKDKSKSKKTDKSEEKPLKQTKVEKIQEDFEFL